MDIFFIRRNTEPVKMVLMFLFLNKCINKKFDISNSPYGLIYVNYWLHTCLLNLILLKRSLVNDYTKKSNLYLYKVFFSENIPNFVIIGSVSYYIEVNINFTPAFFKKF